MAGSIHCVFFLLPVNSGSPMSSSNMCLVCASAHERYYRRRVKNIGRGRTLSEVMLQMEGQREGKREKQRNRKRVKYALVTISTNGLQTLVPS